jgi:hypothetical protein
MTGLFGSSGGAGGGLFGGGGYGISAARPAPKKRKAAWWEKAIDAGAGVLGGIAHTVGDGPMELLTGGKWESQVDDIGRFIIEDYKKRYTSWDDFKSDPVAGVLDVLTVGAAAFTLGGSLAVRGAALAGRAGAAAKFAGLAESADLTTLGRMVGTKHPAFLKAVASEEAAAASALGKKGMIDAALSGQRGRVIVRPDGTVLTPARGALRGVDGSLLETIPLAQSPLRRLMQTSGHTISNRAPKRGLIGSEVRAAKQHNRIDRILDENTVKATFGAGGAQAVRKAAKKLDEREEAALFARNTLGTADEGPAALAGMYGRNADELESALQLPAHLQRRIADEAAIGMQVLKAAGKDGDRATVAREVADQIREEAQAAAENPQQSERLMQKLAAANKIAERADAKELDTYVQHKANLAEAMREGEPLIQQLRMRRDILNMAEVDTLFRAPTKLMLRVEKAQGSASRFTTEFIKGDLNKNVREGMADGTMLARMALGRELTEDEAKALVVRTHTKVHDRKQTAREVRGKYAKRPSAPKTKPSSTPTFSKYSRGYNFAYAQDSMSPAAVFRSWNEARAYKAKTRVLKRVAASGIRIDSEEQRAALKATGEFEFVGGKHDILKKASVLRDKLDNEVRLIVGDSFAREEASDVLGELLAKHVDDAAEYAMPKVYFKHLTTELRRADNFVTRLIDTPTAIFRAAVLNLRPAWMVNNFIGQSMLLLYSQGVLHGVREYMTEVNRAVKTGALRKSDEFAGILDESAGALTMGAGTQAKELAEAGIAAERGYGLGWLVKWPGLRRMRDQAGKPEGSLAAHTLALSVKAMPSGLKGLSDFMGRVNSVLTDDIPRRAAFMGAARPIISRVKKLNPELSDEDALRIALADDDVAARLVDRTMGDLIDFSRMNTAEREVVRRLLPFYGWLKGITLRTGRLVRDDPHKALASYQLGRGYVDGAEARWGGSMPGNLKGAIRVGTDENGEPRIVTVNGMNIFQTPADIAGIAANLLGKGEMKLGGTHPFSQLNPIVKAPVEVAIGRDLFFGGPLYSSPEKGVANMGILDKPWTPEDESRSKPAAMASRYLAALGPMALYQRYKKAGPFGEEEQRLLARDRSDTIGAYLGLPQATLNVERAEALANDAVKYGLVRYDPTAGETPGVFGRQQQSTASTPIF